MRNKLADQRETGLQHFMPHEKLVRHVGEDGPRELEAWLYAAMQNLESSENARKKGVPVAPNRSRPLPIMDTDLVADTFATGLPILDKLATTDLNNLTPMQALELVAELKEAIEKEGWKWDK